ncbi:cytochrome c-type biogenesis protein CcmH [Neobacillus notoginsengisoli]|uniref:Cytochrome c-type biogenesis protein n=1 Tax=Neobacillus notoginsengisoli TaxID=1578198 RepID=A0A417YV57_9BACI|nr:cytochrome c-type biogenesis protein [Neobacillus notoginsengisoli]RHW41102.1 cytochrome c-type biogenesis protein CcmH [Neobacillus notoginsengisoli]
MWKKIYAGLLIFLVVFQGSLAQVQAKQFDYKSKEFKAVASQFSCTCGCGQDHYECDPNTCNLTVEFKKDLVDMMNKGMDKDEIRKYYIGIYGEEILTAPEKEGFSLTAWILPFVALGGAGTALFFVIRKWVKKKGTEAVPLDELTGQDEVENEILSSIIDEERKKYL